MDFKIEVESKAIPKGPVIKNLSVFETIQPIAIVEFVMVGKIMVVVLS